jgi:hypothetical protein
METHSQGMHGKPFLMKNQTSLKGMGFKNVSLSKYKA